jgi:glycosyltransferase involved in cell wall biosynthesis
MDVGKGVDFLIEAMSSLPSNVVYLFVGGSEVDIQEYKIIAKQNKVQDRVFFVGRVPYNELAKYLKVADAFVAPFPDTEHYRHYMSPIKLFEYMAVGKPVIASDLPSIKEVLGKYGFYFTPENMNEFIAAVNTVCDENDLNQEYTEDLLGHSRQYTWDKRAKNIIEFIAVVLRT